MGVGMGNAIPYSSCRAAIVAVLIDCARQRRTIFYGELGELVGVPAQGPWKPILDDIAKEFVDKAGVDITYLVINKRYRLPGQIGFSNATPPTASQRQKAHRTIESVFAKYAPGA
jgi:hypothetical protein